MIAFKTQILQRARKSLEILPVLPYVFAMGAVSMVVVLSGCASSSHRTYGERTLHGQMDPELDSVVYGYIEVMDQNGVKMEPGEMQLTSVTLHRKSEFLNGPVDAVVPAKKSGRDGIFYVIAREGEYSLLSFSGKIRGKHFSYSLPQQHWNPYKMKVDSAGVYFMGSLRKVSKEKKAFDAKDRFDLVLVPQPSEQKVRKRLAQHARGTMWESMIFP